MDAFIPMLKNTLLFVALAIPGYLLVKIKLLKQQDSAVLSNLLTYIGLPFMIFSGTIGVSFNADTLTNIWISAVFAIVVTVSFFFLTNLFYCKIKAKDGEDVLTLERRKGMLRFCTLLSNNGFLGLPLAAAVFGNNVFTCMVIFNIITNMCIYTLGVYLSSCDRKLISGKKIVFNPVLIAFVLGVICNLLGVKNLVPEVVGFSDHFKNLVTPIAMLVLGMKMGNIKFSVLFKYAQLYTVSLYKLIVMPVVATAVAFCFYKLGYVGLDIVNAVFIAFAMPTAGLAPVFADKFKSDIDCATICTLGTTIFSIITIPLLYLLKSSIV